MFLRKKIKEVYKMRAQPNERASMERSVRCFLGNGWTQMGVLYEKVT